MDAAQELSLKRIFTICATVAFIALVSGVAYCGDRDGQRRKEFATECVAAGKLAWQGQCVETIPMRPWE